MMKVPSAECESACSHVYLDCVVEGSTWIIFQRVQHILWTHIANAETNYDMRRPTNTLIYTHRIMWKISMTNADYNRLRVDMCVTLKALCSTVANVRLRLKKSSCGQHFIIHNPISRGPISQIFTCRQHWTAKERVVHSSRKSMFGRRHKPVQPLQLAVHKFASSIESFHI